MIRAAVSAASASASATTSFASVGSIRPGGGISPIHWAARRRGLLPRLFSRGGGDGGPPAPTPPPPPPRRRLAETDADFFEAADPPPRPPPPPFPRRPVASGAFVPAPAASDAGSGARGGTGPDARARGDRGRAPPPPPSSSAGTSAAGAEEAAGRTRSVPQPPPPPRPRASSSPRRPPPSVLEYDYDYVDEELGVSGAFGDAGEANFDAASTSASAPSPPSAAAAEPRAGGPPAAGPRAGGPTAATRRPLDDPEYDPSFSLGAEAGGGGGPVPLLPGDGIPYEGGEEGDDDGAAYGFFDARDDGDGGAGMGMGSASGFDDTEGSVGGARSESGIPRLEARSQSEYGSYSPEFDAVNDARPSTKEALQPTVPSDDDRVENAHIKPVEQSRKSQIEDKPRARSGYMSRDYFFKEEEAEMRQPTEPRQNSRMKEVRGVASPESQAPETTDAEATSRYSLIEDAPDRPQTQPPRGERAEAATRLSADVTPETMDFLSGSASGHGASTRASILSSRLDRIKSDVFAANGGRKLNVNSPRQVAEALFGRDGRDQSTNRDVLEAMASGGNRLADLILSYRKCRSDLKREERRVENRRNGSHVASVGDMHGQRTGTGTAPGGGPSRRPASTPAPRRREYVDDDDVDPLLLLDASAYIFRAYYSMPPLHRNDGMPVGAVLGFCNMLNRLVLNRLLRGQRPRLALVFDSGGPNFRHDLYPEYKANRPPCPEDLVPQFDLIREAADAYGVAQVEAEGYEADDVIATLSDLARGEGVDVNILSGDKDLMQLVTPPDVTPCVQMIDPMKMVRISYDVVLKRWGVPPEMVGDVLALAGDTSDNIPGVPGVGPKTAAALLDEFGTLDALLGGADRIKQKGRREKVTQNIDKARLSRALVNLERSIPVENMTLPERFRRIGDIRMDALSADRLLDYYTRMGLADLKRRVQSRLSGGARGGKSADAGPASSHRGRGGGTTARTGALGAGPRGPSDPRPAAGRPASGEYVAFRSRADHPDGGGGLLSPRRRRASPPKPEEYDDVPF